jgi:hypothetical protein
MSDAPDWLLGLLGWKNGTETSRKKCEELFDGKNIAPNLSDLGSKSSMHLSGLAYDSLGISRDKVTAINLDEKGEEDKKSSVGNMLEKAIEKDLCCALKEKDEDRQWKVSRDGTVAQFAQFSHLEEMQAILVKYPTLRSTFARDYQVKSDVYVGVENSLEPSRKPFLHAAISSKWTIRSDRVQNVRYEFASLVRNRRGRSPHLVLVTAEPLPSRLISIGRGTGEVDAVYHLLFNEIDAAVRSLKRDRWTQEQIEKWAELVEQNRIKPYSQLVKDLILS